MSNVNQNTRVVDAMSPRTETVAGSHSQVSDPDVGHSSTHVSNEYHHHHAHAAGSLHAGGHHLLQVENLSVGFQMYDSAAPFFSAEQRMSNVIDKLSISVHVGEIVAVVGASGSGKTLLADSIMGLFEPNAQVSGEIWFDGNKMDAKSLQQARGNGISLVPQGVSHLNPLVRVGKQVDGFGYSKDEAAKREERRKALFERYGLAPEVARMYPHELSGGMARRVLLCTALMDNPKLIIADEPTPGLDLPLAQAALKDFRDFANAGGGVMLITHDIELALSVADRVAVFRDGTVVEETAVENFASPELLQHPFTKALWHALPEHGFRATKDELLDTTNNAAFAMGASNTQPGAIGGATC